MGGGGGLPDRDSLLLVPTGRARVLIREYHGSVRHFIVFIILLITIRFVWPRNY